MQTLTLKNTMKNITLLTAGALMATMIAVPLSGIASADDDGDNIVLSTPVSNIYTIQNTRGVASRFELVERDGEMFLVLVVPEEVSTPFSDDDDDGE